MEDTASAAQKMLRVAFMRVRGARVGAMWEVVNQRKDLLST